MRPRQCKTLRTDAAPKASRGFNRRLRSNGSSLGPHYRAAGPRSGLLGFA